MILQALSRYYDLLSAQPPDEYGLFFPPLWFGKQRISCSLRLDWEGNVTGVLSVKSERRIPGKKGKEDKIVYEPQPMALPMAYVRGNDKLGNFLWDNATYLLGYDSKGNAENAKKSFEAAQCRHREVLKDVHTPSARAVLGFFESYPQGKLPPAIENDKAMLEDTLKGCNFVFLLPDGRYAHDHDELTGAWKRYRDNQESDLKMQCLVTGEQDAPIALIHPKVKGVRDAQGVGANLVSYNSAAYTSYGLEGGANGPVSVRAAFAYTTVLNELLSSKENTQVIGGSTLVYWAESADRRYVDIMNAMSRPAGEDQQQKLHDIMTRAAGGLPLLSEGLDPETPFYILCLAPNAARLSVRFFLRDTFGNIIRNNKSHYERLAIVRPAFDSREYLTPWELLRETVFAGSKDDAASPLLAGALLRAIYSGSDYPEALVQSVLRRVHAELSINRAKAAILKAYLLKKHPDDKEEIKVGLDETNNNPYYVLGRMFAVLEFTQMNSSDAAIGASIGKKFFSSACDTPLLVFPQLLKHNNIYLNRMDAGKSKFYRRMLEELIERLDADTAFPANLTNEQQARYLVGYHHQRQALYTKKSAASPEAGAEQPQDTQKEDA